MILTARYVLPIVGSAIDDGAVVVRDGRIAAVGAFTDIHEYYPDDEVRDFGVAALLPGFVDAHGHLEFSTMGGIFEDMPYAAWRPRLLEKGRMLKPADWQDAAVLGAVQSLTAGITTVADVTATGAPLRALRLTGQHGVVYREVDASSADEVAPAMEAARRDVEAWRAFGAENGMLLRVGMGPGSLYAVHPEVLRQIGEAARTSAEPLPVAVHLSGSREECDFIRYGSLPFALGGDLEGDRVYRGIQTDSILATGVSPVRFALNWGILYAPEVLAIHCVHLDPGDVERLAEQQVSVVMCPRSNAKLGCGVTPLLDLRQAGIRVALGTNSPAAADSIDPLEEMRFGLLLQRATSGEREFLHAKTFLRMSTIDAARALGLDDQVGSLEVGKRADVVAIDLSRSMQVPTRHPHAAVVHSANRDDVLMTMIDGREVYTRDKGLDLGGELKATNARAVLRRAEELRIRLRA